ncbi:hypothetical protein Tco_0421615 [Tanacetum coccineum]
MVNAMFVSPGLSHGMWGKAMISATYLLDILVKKIYTRMVNWNKDVLPSFENIFPLFTKEIGRSSEINNGSCPRAVDNG